MTEEVGDRRSRFPSVSRPLQVLALAVLVVIISATAQQLLTVRAAIIEDTKRQMSRLDMVFAEQNRSRRRDGRLYPPQRDREFASVAGHITRRRRGL